MRCASRNKRKFWFANYVDKIPVTAVDEWGNNIQTGDYAIGYAAIVKSKANISAPSGFGEWDLFGSDITFSKTITIADPNTSITENTVLWIDTEPSVETNPSKAVNCGGTLYTKYDYVVKRVARYMHSAVIAIEKVH